MKASVEANCLDYVVKAICDEFRAALFCPLKKPLGKNSIWNIHIKSLLNILLDELYSENKSFTFIFGSSEGISDRFLLISLKNPKDKKSDLGDELAALDQTVVKLTEIKQILLTESSWQVLTSENKYYVPTLRQDVVLHLLSLCLMHLSDTSSNPISDALDTEGHPSDPAGIYRVCITKEGINLLLCQQFGFNSIFSTEEYSVFIEDFGRMSAQLSEKVQSSEFQIVEKRKQQVAICDQIVNHTCNKPSTRTMHGYYQFAKLHFELELLMGQVFNSEQLTTSEAIKIKQNIGKIINSCMSIPFVNVGDEGIPLIIRGLLEMSRFGALALSETEIEQSENGIIRKMRISQKCVNFAIAQEITEKLMEHCRICLKQRNFHRVNDICSELEEGLFNYFKEVDTSALPELNIVTELKEMISAIKLQSRPSQTEIASSSNDTQATIHRELKAITTSSNPPGDAGDGLEMMRATFEMNRRFGYGTKSLSLDDICRIAADGEFRQLKLLISHDSDDKPGLASVESCSSANLSLLQYAVANNRQDTVEFLLAQKANPNREDDNGVTPLMWMIKCDYPISSIAMLLQHDALINDLNSQGYSPLHFAVFFGKHAVVIVLKGYAADVNQKIEKPKTKLTRTKVKLKVVEAIPYYNCDNKLPRMIEEPIVGDTALHMALRKRDEQMVLLLLDMGADLNLCTKDGTSPLVLAAQYTPNLILFFLQKGADLEETLQSGKVSFAKLTQYFYRNRPDLLKGCINVKPSIVTEKFDDGNTLLHQVIQNASSSEIDKELLQLILSHGGKIDCNKHNKKTQKAIHLAIEVGIDDACICALAEHTELTMSKRDIHSVLVLCLNNKRSNQLIQFLLERKASVNDHAFNTEHPLSIAIREHSQNTELLTLLLNHGAWLGSDKKMEALLKIAKSNKVDATVIKIIISKMEEQKAVAVEREPRPSAKSDNTAAKERHEQVQRDWDRVACWDATGNRWERGGRPDDSFYVQMQTFFTSGREESVTRDQTIANHIKGHVKPKRVVAPKIEKAKPATKKASAVTEVTEAQESKPQTALPPVNVVPKKAVSVIKLPAAEPKIDWSAPSEQKKKKKHKAKKARAAQQPEVTQNDILPIQLAENEALFLEDMCTWRSKLDKPMVLHDEVCEDVRKFSLFLIFLGISAADELKQVEFNTGEHNNNAVKESIFTVDDRHATSCRNNIMHKFPSNQLLVKTCDAIVFKNLGPRLKVYQKSKTIRADLPAVNLSKGELYNCEMAEINVNERILEHFRRIANYTESLEKEFGRQVTAFKLLDKQNHAQPILLSSEISFTCMDVYTARAIESCLVWLGKLYTLYIDQDEKLKTLPSAMITFMADVYKHIRNIFAHQVGENEQWHYSPIDVNFIQEYMRLAVDVFRSFKAEETEKRLAPPPLAPQNRIRLAFTAQPFVPGAGNDNNNNAETGKAKLNPFASKFEPRN